ncbi:uncharacterized protein AMSG_04959 [Thecamonas trahens ATCC 50062]|uniref:COMM domain-containing protein n=1 Tax=Thecamonas trahens ATCC 50062 TaxID=461836 RepID=A0A0L0D8E4_THETB|nr:hypothetical protein AMSG_04959 [Thecamonas trahens ATCC 50062]KNC48515.1 hypothetical protein AMSG_04959 [Thecamonas trahens ATCC 50062]|eukprot:XP_013758623.1 hypothetical protein AMSG_04959 [Thecamonas trahens ATCC 50062]
MASSDGEARLHCLGGVPSAHNLKLLAYVKDVCDWSDGDLVMQFLHAIIDDLCSKPQSYVQRFQECASIDSILGSVEAFKLLFTNAIKFSLSNEAIASDLATLGVDRKLFAPIVGVLRSRTDELRLALVVASSQIASAYMTDFDWKLNVTLGSDKIAALHQPKLLLNVQVEQVSGESSDMTVEFTKESLDEMLAQMEAQRVAGAK